MTLTFCRAKTRHPWAGQWHVAHAALALTLCGRVRPGERALELPEDARLCPRCAYRLRDLGLHDTMPSLVQSTEDT